MLEQSGLQRFVFAVAIVSGLYGCASGGIQRPTGEPVLNVLAAIETGEARLACGVTCAGAWVATRSQAKMLYDNALWKDLAIEVARVGFKSDQTYFYLGRAAEGLGFVRAALIYYKLALESDYKCAVLLNNCEGLVFPREAYAGLDRLPAPVSASKPATTSDRNTPVPAAGSPVTATTRAEALPKRETSSPKPATATTRADALPKTATSSPSAPDPRQADLRATIEVKYDEFKKVTNYTGANVAADPDRVFLRAWKPDGSSATFQIYAMDHYSGEWRFYNSVLDSNGTKLDVTLISRDIGSCNRQSGCTRHEHVGINITRDYLEKHRQSGIRFKLGGLAGDEIFSVPAAHINAFLEVVK